MEHVFIWGKSFRWYIKHQSKVSFPLTFLVLSPSKERNPLYWAHMHTRDQKKNKQWPFKYQPTCLLFEWMGATAQLGLGSSSMLESCARPSELWIWTKSGEQQQNKLLWWSFLQVYCKNKYAAKKLQDTVSVFPDLNLYFTLFRLLFKSWLKKNNWFPYFPWNNLWQYYKLEFIFTISETLPKIWGNTNCNTTKV